MFGAMWVVVLGLLTLFFQGLWEHQSNPNGRVSGTEAAGGARKVVLRANRAHHYVATGTINGKPATFLLDTGASDVAVPASVAERIGLPRGRREAFHTANGRAVGYSTHLDRVELGGIAVHDVRGSINPGMDGDVVLLGMSFLRQLEFTQRGDELILRQAPAPQ